MRIIAGTFRSRTIHAPDGEATRPTTDRSRESLFNVLANMIDLDGARVLDLFAGSGAVSIEAISRGAKSATLVEKDYRALASIRRNVEAFDLARQVRIAPTDVYMWLHNFPGGAYDLVFADSPYRDKRSLLELPAAIIARDIVEQDGIAVIEHSSHDTVVLPNEARHIRTLKVGEATFTFFGHKESERSE